MNCCAKTAGRKKDIEQIHVKLVEELMEHQTGREIMLPYEMTGERCYEGIWLHKVKDHGREYKSISSGRRS